MSTENRLWVPPSVPFKNRKQGSRLKMKPMKLGFSEKTLWDWLNLLAALAIPLVVAFATIAFGLLQIHLADQQHLQDQKLAQQQHDADQLSSLDQQRATILQTYIDNIQDLLLNHNLHGSTLNSEVSILARARTLTALQGWIWSAKPV